VQVGSRTGFGDDRATAAPIPPKGILRDYAETILICVIFVVFTRAFIFQQSKIPSGSMEDTLLIGDYIMVNRYVFSPADSAWEKTLLPVRDVRRGDVFFFK
jgi:signal peptidase I